VTEKPQDEQQSDWEDEGGATAPESKQITPKGLASPVPKREDVLDALAKVAKPKPEKV
jgi:hypothetical protein